MELERQVAIVTGAGRGIGRATALELARLGADVVIAEVDKGTAEKTAEEVARLGRRALVVSTDVTSRADLAAMAERTSTDFGRIDVLVNNAGIYRGGSNAGRHRGALGRGVRLQRKGSVFRHSEGETRAGDPDQ
jgi:NAD(P)-dependent dehydrogenase (short-subunit alcohol dehydrogenase family)